MINIDVPAQVTGPSKGLFYGTGIVYAGFTRLILLYGLYHVFRRDYLACSSVHRSRCRPAMLGEWIDVS